jgi:hypothetical protein
MMMLGMAGLRPSFPKMVSPPMADSSMYLTFHSMAAELPMLVHGSSGQSLELMTYLERC